MNKLFNPHLDSRYVIKDNNKVVKDFYLVGFKAGYAQALADEKAKRKLKEPFSKWVSLRWPMLKPWFAKRKGKEISNEDIRKVLKSFGMLSKGAPMGTLTGFLKGKKIICRVEGRTRKTAHTEGHDRTIHLWTVL